MGESGDFSQPEGQEVNIHIEPEKVLKKVLNAQKETNAASQSRSLRPAAAQRCICLHHLPTAACEMEAAANRHELSSVAGSCSLTLAVAHLPATVYKLKQPVQALPTHYTTGLEFCLCRQNTDKDRFRQKKILNELQCIFLNVQRFGTEKRKSMYCIRLKKF